MEKKIEEFQICYYANSQVKEDGPINLNEVTLVKAVSAKLWK